MKREVKAVLVGAAATLFTSMTYVINSGLAGSGYSWMWSGALRFLLMLPPLWLIIWKQGRVKAVFQHMREHLVGWLIWGNIGFPLFYMALAYASAYGPPWLVAGSFQFTILAGALLTPLFPQRNAQGQVVGKGKIPVHLFPAFAVILIGVFLLQWQNAKESGMGEGLLFLVPVLWAAVAYPLGNRKMMELVDGQLSTPERVFGMTVISVPVCLLFCGAGYVSVGWPPVNQVLSVLAVAVFAGLIATLIFFQATQSVQNQPQWLAMVESTQCGEVVFSLLFGAIFLHSDLPDTLGWIGLVLIVGGMLFNSYKASKHHSSV